MPSQTIVITGLPAEITDRLESKAEALEWSVADLARDIIVRCVVDDFKQCYSGPKPETKKVCADDRRKYQRVPLGQGVYIKANEAVNATLVYSGELRDISLTGIGLVIEDQTGEIINIIKEQKKFKVSLRPGNRQDPFIFDCVYRRHEDHGQTSLVGATFVATEYDSEIWLHSLVSEAEKESD